MRSQVRRLEDGEGGPHILISSQKKKHSHPSVRRQDEERGEWDTGGSLELRRGQEIDRSKDTSAGEGWGSVRGRRGHAKGSGKEDIVEGTQVRDRMGRHWDMDGQIVNEEDRQRRLNRGEVRFQHVLHTRM